MVDDETATVLGTPDFGVETMEELVAMGEAQSVHDIPAVFPSFNRRGIGVDVARADGDENTDLASVLTVGVDKESGVDEADEMEVTHRGDEATGVDTTVAAEATTVAVTLDIGASI